MKGSFKYSLNLLSSSGQSPGFPLLRKKYFLSRFEQTKPHAVSNHTAAMVIICRLLHMHRTL